MLDFVFAFVSLSLTGLLIAAYALRTALVRHMGGDFYLCFVLSSHNR